jgi:light-regulated signal transduction histidine kinase (bacteriophytochrome)
MLVLTLKIEAFAVPTIHKLGGSIRETLYRNYVSIEAAQHLTIAKEIVEAHVGRVFVDGTLGEGTFFTLELPAGQEELWQSS